MCVYSISVSKTKNTTPDTSASVIRFTDMVDEVYKNSGNAVIYLSTNPYSIDTAGTYTITITTTWGTPLQTQVTYFKLTANDLC